MSDSLSTRVPAGLDEEGRALFDEAVAYMRDNPNSDFLFALGAVTGNDDLKRRSAVGALNLAQAAGTDSQAFADARTAFAYARSQGINFETASSLLDAIVEIGELEADDGSGEAPWLDVRPLSSPPQPWSTDDWERDRRRAARAGISLSKELWQGYAEQGRDYVGEQFVAQRQAELEQRRQELARAIDSAQQGEDQARRGLIEEELRRRARERLSADRQRLAASPG
jgi:hypothetical protein